MVYADWLEDRGDERAKFLRLESLMWTLPGELDALRARLDPAWLAAVARTIDLYLASCVNKIQAIKLVREITNMGLKESKDLVESPLPALIKRDINVERALRWAAEGEMAGTKLEVRRGSTPLAQEALLGMGLLTEDMRVIVEGDEPFTEDQRDLLQELIGDVDPETLPPSAVLREGLTKGAALALGARLRSAGLSARIELMF